MAAVSGRTTADLQVQIQIAPAILAHESEDDIEPCRMRQRWRHADAGKAAVEPVEMLAQAKRPSCIDRYDLVDRVAEQERAVQRRDARLPQGEVLAVQVTDVEGHSCAGEVS
jgi:hypothetical protein